MDFHDYKTETSTGELYCLELGRSKRNLTADLNEGEKYAVPEWQAISGFTKTRQGSR